MASTGKMDVEIEVKSHADKFFEALKDSVNVLPKAFPNDYKSIEVLEGDGKSTGSIRLIHYGEGSPLVKVSKEKVDIMDEANKTFVYCVIDGDLLKFYKNFKSNISVIPKGAGSLVKWSCEFEKASEEIPDPHLIKDFAAKNFKELDDYVLKAY
ncbi:MLP-like protein 423 [Quercus lobata]|uniref:Bet v I/Major latex protein domain-containing protein n=1 Tax=Quercus lobata TaxID=97700 RepID=A0A7N2R1U9_QUELO|nr:MLP-like protein 423 [Quercus lobata]